MLNRRFVPLLIGALGAALGVVAVVTSTVVVGLVAGITALLAGAVALTLEDPAAAGRRVTEAETAQRLGEAELNTARGELSEARQRIDSLDEEVRRLTESAGPAGHGTPRGGDVADRSALVDAATDLFSEPYFHVALDTRIASARRHLRPVAIALIEVHEGMPATTSQPAPPERAAESIRETIRDADTACRLADGSFAIILEDTPENGAVWTVERVRRNLVSRFGNHTMWAGVACYPAHAFSAADLLEQARAALVSAQEWNQDRIEVAVAD